MNNISKSRFKIFIIIFSLLILAQTSIGQITIDSFHVYHTGQNIDSLYIQGKKSSSQKLIRSSFAPHNDKCGTIYGAISFNDCLEEASNGGLVEIRSDLDDQSIYLI